MFATARKYINSISECEDVVQESVLKLLSKIDILKRLEQQQIANYIVVTTKNTAINYLKKKSKELYEPLEDDNETIVDIQVQSLDDMLISKEKRKNFRTVWAKLSERDKTLLEGKYILSMSDTELAAQIGCQVGSIRMLLTRARRNALKKLNEYNEVLNFEE